MSVTDHTPRWVDSILMWYHGRFLCDHVWEAIEFHPEHGWPTVKQCEWCGRTRGKG